MDLKDFIQTAVTEIVDGVLAAQAAASAHHVAVNPAVDAKSRGNDGARVNNISFDVAVTGVEGSVTPGSGKLRVAQASTAGEQCARLQFSLPIAFPEARLPRSTASTLDSEFMQTVNNADSTWLPS
ncbi:MAG TPA: hypothetical protein VL624_21875 [Caldimonas sp.]|nr:hypothetical protein [Caldimonas sp.]